MADYISKSEPACPLALTEFGGETGSANEKRKEDVDPQAGLNLAERAALLSALNSAKDDLEQERRRAQINAAIALEQTKTHSLAIAGLTKRADELERQLAAERDGRARDGAEAAERSANAKRETTATVASLTARIKELERALTLERERHEQELADAACRYDRVVEEMRTMGAELQAGLADAERLSAVHRALGVQVEAVRRNAESGFSSAIGCSTDGNRTDGGT